MALDFDDDELDDDGDELDPLDPEDFLDLLDEAVADFTEDVVGGDYE